MKKKKTLEIENLQTSDIGVPRVTNNFVKKYNTYCTVEIVLIKPVSSDSLTPRKFPYFTKIIK